ncbi:hypothetical protein GBA52_020730 [Prunus armeniaca]|nr:hypothetical protein GBA52_020730 [Prunus armeniaca]
MAALEDQIKATLKLFVATQNMVAHRDLDWGRRDEQAMTVAELKRTIGEKAKVEEELEQTRSRLEEEEKRNVELHTLNYKTSTCLGMCLSNGIHQHN